MTDPLKALLYKNEAFTEAFDAAMASQDEVKVAFNGKTWTVGGTKVDVTTKELSFVQSVVRQIGNLFHKLFSRSYAERCESTINKFKNAILAQGNARRVQGQESVRLAFQETQASLKLERGIKNKEAELKPVKDERRGFDEERKLVQSQIKSQGEAKTTLESTIQQLEGQLKTNENEQQTLQTELQTELQNKSEQGFFSWIGAATAFIFTSKEPSLEGRVKAFKDEHTRLKAQLEKAQNQLKMLQEPKQELQSSLKWFDTQIAECDKKITQVENDIKKMRDGAVPEKEIAEETETETESEAPATPVEEGALPSAEQAAPAPLEETSQTTAAKEAAFELNEPSKLFLAEVGKHGLKLRKLFENMLTNISEKNNRENIVEKFENTKGTFTLTFKQQTHFLICPIKAIGVNEDPIASVIFTFGNEQGKLIFTLEKDLFKVKEGLSVHGHRPDGFFYKVLPEWPDSQVYSISTAADQNTFEVGKAGITKKAGKDLTLALHNWRYGGEKVNPANNEELVEILKSKASQQK